LSSSGANVATERIQPLQGFYEIRFIGIEAAVRKFHQNRYSSKDTKYNELITRERTPERPVCPYVGVIHRTIEDVLDIAVSGQNSLGAKIGFGSKNIRCLP
jgi:hypothetical protein